MIMFQINRCQEDAEYQKWKEKWYECMQTFYEEILAVSFPWYVDGDYLIHKNGYFIYDLRKIYSGESKVEL